MLLLRRVHTCVSRYLGWAMALAGAPVDTPPAASCSVNVKVEVRAHDACKASKALPAE